MKIYERQIGDLRYRVIGWKVVISAIVIVVMMALALYEKDLFKESEDIYLTDGWKAVDTSEYQLDGMTADSQVYEFSFRARYRYLTSIHLMFDTKNLDAFSKVENIQVVNKSNGIQPSTMPYTDGILITEPLHLGARYTMYIAASDALSIDEIEEVKFCYNFNGITSYLLIFCMTVLACLIFCVKIDEEGNNFLLKKIRGLIVLLTPALTFFIMENITESLPYMTFLLMVINIAFYYMIYAIIFALSNRIRFTMIFTTLVFVFYGIVEHYVVTFRTTPIVPYDIFSVGTALTVSGGYHYEISGGMWIGILETIVLILLLFRCKGKIVSRKKRLLNISVTAIASTIYISLFYSVIIDAAELSFFFWNPYQTYSEYGCVVSDFLYFNYMSLDKPNGYSKQAAEDILARYSDDDQEIAVASYEGIQAVANQSGTAEGGIVPDDIIVIMNESWADLSCVGDFTTNIPYSEYYDSLTENTIKGTTSVSIYGGNTPQSEYEFLTGNTISFLPSGAIAYNLYIKNTTPSLVSQLSALGYDCIAMHPEKATNFNRNNVYPKLGFSSFLTEDEFTDAKRIRDLCSDKSVYNKVIDLYENKDEGEKLFLYAVTMQNHGGYTYEEDDFTDDVQVLGMNGEYGKVNQYLTCMRDTDEALEFLISYFQRVDDNIMIVMFGDHQGDVGSDFYEELYGRELMDVSSEQYEKRYETPFLIWTNYDIDESENNKISLNYLAGLAMETANIPLTEYQLFLAELHEKFPVISASAIYDAEGNFYTWNTVTESPDYSYIEEYKILEYYMLESYK